jgi:hypothetical protein
MTHYADFSILLFLPRSHVLLYSIISLYLRIKYNNWRTLTPSSDPRLLKQASSSEGKAGVKQKMNCKFVSLFLLITRVMFGSFEGAFSLFWMFALSEVLLELPTLWQWGPGWRWSPAVGRVDTASETIPSYSHVADRERWISLACYQGF